MALLRVLLMSLALAGCSAEVGRELPPDLLEQPTEPEPTEPCEPVACEIEVGSTSLAYFTSPDCSPASRVLPVKPNDPVAYMTLCELGEAGALAHVWVTAGQVSAPAGVWGGADCRDLSHMFGGYDLWKVVELDMCE